MDRLAGQPAIRSPADMRLRAAWAASLAVLLLFAMSAFAWRNDVMRSWPPSTRMYSALGLTPPAH